MTLEDRRLTQEAVTDQDGVASTTEFDLEGVHMNPKDTPTGGLARP